jgi:type III secretion protein J
MKKNSFCKNLCGFFSSAALLLLAGCGQVELLSNLPEKEANEIISIMQQHKIPIVKVHGIETTWSIVLKNANDFSRAIQTLNTRGYPNTQYNSIGQIFQKSGLVSSPLEERARFMYALSEGIAETLNKIPGVLTSRVHIVLPENDPYSDDDTEASAAIFLTYKAGGNLDESVREIKYLVANSVQGLDYDKVSIALFPVAFDSEADDAFFDSNVSVLGLSMASDAATKFLGIVIVLVILVVCLLVTTIVFLLESKKAKRSAGATGATGTQSIAAPVVVQKDEDGAMNELDEGPAEPGGPAAK